MDNRSCEDPYIAGILQVDAVARPPVRRRAGPGWEDPGQPIFRGWYSQARHCWTRWHPFGQRCEDRGDAGSLGRRVPVVWRRRERAPDWVRFGGALFEDGGRATWRLVQRCSHVPAPSPRQVVFQPGLSDGALPAGMASEQSLHAGEQHFQPMIPSSYHRPLPLSAYCLNVHKTFRKADVHACRYKWVIQCQARMRPLTNEILMMACALRDAGTGCERVTTDYVPLTVTSSESPCGQ